VKAKLNGVTDKGKPVEARDKLSMTVDQSGDVKVTVSNDELAQERLRMQQEQSKSMQEIQNQRLALGEEKQNLERLKYQNKSDDETVKVLAGEMASTLKNERPEADKAMGAIPRLDEIDGLLRPETTGVEGQVKAYLAPFVQAFRDPKKWESFNDAAKKDIFMRSQIGAMRLELIGPGPVSEYEQKLMQDLAGGRRTPLDVAKALVSYYRENAVNKVKRYNASVDRASKVNSIFGTVYGKIDESGLQRGAAPQGGGIRAEQIQVGSELPGVGKIKGVRWK
jgi:hypothetical protein